MAVNGKPECVYGTFLIDDDYAKGVLALYRSIRATKTSHPFVVSLVIAAIIQSKN